METFICNHCSKLFKKYRSQVKNNKGIFCSKKCFDDYRRFDNVQKKCFRCETTWIAVGSQSKEYRRKFCSEKCEHEHYSELYKGKQRSGSKGWRITTQGYIELKYPDHPKANSNGFVKRSILIMEEKIGRHLTKEEVVHHIDKDKKNDDPDNLMLFGSNSEHIEYHYKFLGDTHINNRERRSKLSADTMREIKRIFTEETNNMSDIARRFDISSQTVDKIVHDKSDTYKKILEMGG